MESITMREENIEELIQVIQQDLHSADVPPEKVKELSDRVNFLVASHTTSEVH